MYLSISSSLSPAHQVSQSVEPCLRREIFLALLLLTAATASFAHADEGHAFDITTPANAPRKVLNGESNGKLQT